MMKHRAASAMFGFMIVSVLVLGLGFAPTVSGGDVLVAQTHLHPGGGTHQWWAYPDNITGVDKVQSNDGDTTYIQINTTKAYRVEVFNFTTFTDPGYPNQSHWLKIWVIAKTNLGIPTGKLYIYATDIMYAVSLPASSMTGVSNTLVSATSYKNYTLRAWTCPWTQQNWTATSINALKLYLYTNGVGTIEVTEVGVIVSTTSVTENVTVTIDPSTWVVILALIFDFVFLFIGLKEPTFFILAGIVWIITSLAVFGDYGEVFMMVGLIVGIVGVTTGGAKAAGWV